MYKRQAYGVVKTELNGRGWTKWLKIPNIKYSDKNKKWGVSELKKSSISIMYDDEKLSAIKLYMSQRDLDFKEELEKSVDSLYAVSYTHLDVYKRQA